MFINKRSITGAFSSGIILLSLGLTSGATAQAQTAPDNSRNNKAQNHPQNADQQKENTSDREATAKVRRAIVADKSLSTYGHNVKIIVTGGAVTLKGPVHSEDEKQAIGAKASQIVGDGKVSNQLTVKQ